MAEGKPAPDADDLRERANEINDGLVYAGEYSAQELGGSVYSCLPPDFIKRFGIESESGLEIYEDRKLGCALIFPKGALSDE